MTSRDDFVKSGAHLSGGKKKNQRNSKRNLVSPIMTLNRDCCVTMICCLIG